MVGPSTLLVFHCRSPSLDVRDRSGVSQIPFRLNNGEFNVTASVAFAPYVEVAFTVCEFIAIQRILIHH